MERQREDGRDWGSLDGLMWRSLKMGPVSPGVECDGRNRRSLVLGGALMTWTTSTYRPRITTPQKCLARPTTGSTESLARGHHSGVVPRPRLRAAALGELRLSALPATAVIVRIGDQRALFRRRREKGLEICLYHGLKFRVA